MKNLVGSKSRNLDLFNKLFNLEDAFKVENTINSHWSNFWKTTEKNRWTNESKHAYHNLKNILRYHLFEKRDGGIINKILTDDGAIEMKQKHNR